MSATTAHAQHRDQHRPEGAGLRFDRLVRSEWIKLRSLRSTVWCYLILFVLTIAMSVLPSLVIGAGDTESSDAANMTLVLVNTISVYLTELVVAVLGVLIISGEYGTGSIRATFTAEPRRWPVLAAKAFVLAASTFVVSVVSTWVGAFASVPILAAHGVHGDLGDPSVFMPILGASVDVTLVALFAFAVGLLIRSSAGGIAITLGVLLVLPVIVNLIGQVTQAQWIVGIGPFLPAQAGGQLYTYASTAAAAGSGGVVLNGWGGFFVLLGEVVVIGAAAITLARRRDV